MSDEEKKAIEKLSSKKNETNWYDTIRQIKREEIKDVVVTRQKYITSVLNLIEKQSKEIEEIKEELNRQINIREINEKFIEEHFISKDKIKAEIEELQKDIQYSANPLSIDNSKFGIKVLQSLLEKE